MRHTKKLFDFTIMISIMITIMTAIMVLSGCGAGNASTGGGSGADANGTAEASVDQKEDPKEEPSEDNSQKTDAQLDELLGAYSLFASFGEGYLYMGENLYASGSINIYLEDGKYKADYLYSSESADTKYFGMTLSEGSGVFSTDFGSSDRYYTIDKKTNPDDEYIVEYSVASTIKDTLTLRINTTYEYKDEDTGETVSNKYDYYELYVRKGYKETEQLEYDLRYKEKVTVSNVTELYKAIDSGKHIVLKAGTYNVSELISENKDLKSINSLNEKLATIDGDYLSIYGESIQIKEMYNIILEGEEGASVLICTEDSYAVPLEFSYCDNITLKNLTIGHEVEPGYCSGAVVKLDSCNYMNIDKCNLYGCGTYGIEAYGTSNVKVKDTDIYECTYGGIDLYNCYDWEFNDSKIRDSKEYSILGLNECGYIDFNRCEITNNQSGNYGALIDAADSYEIYFKDCTIKDNKYTTFLTGNSVYIEDGNISK